MLVRPNNTTVLAVVTGVQKESKAGDTVVSLRVESNISASPDGDFIRPEAGSTFDAYSIDPVPVRVGQRVLARARLNAGPWGGRVVLESLEVQ